MLKQDLYQVSPGVVCIKTYAWPASLIKKETSMKLRFTIKKPENGNVLFSGQPYTDSWPFIFWQALVSL